MKNRNAIKFFAVLAVVVFCTYLMLCGLKIGDNTVVKGFKDIRTGIDIRGGVSAQLQPKNVDLNTVTDEDLQSVKALIEKRLDDKNILDRTVTPDSEKKRVFVEIPWAAGETEFDANALIEDTIAMAKLTFYEVEPYTEVVEVVATEEPDNKKNKKNNKNKKADEEETSESTGPVEGVDYFVVKGEEDGGRYAKVGEVILEGKDVRNAAAVSQSGQTVVTIDFTSDGQKAFADATATISSKTDGMIGIFMDDTLISAATVKETINSDSCQIESDTFNENKDEALTLASRINAGNMPFEMDAVEVNTISATMGDSAYTVTQYALVIALLLIMIYLIAMYRVLGVVASIALLGHTSVNILVISNLGITLTLPGIAGVILSIGMAVDGNCVIFERVKDELRAGRTLRAAIDAGFKSAFAAVFDGNVTTIICCAVLWYFGTGAIQSFAITTIVGVALSFVSAITASRWLILGTIDLNIATNKTWYGITEKSMARFLRKQEALGLISGGEKKKKR